MHDGLRLEFCGDGSWRLLTVATVGYGGGKRVRVCKRSSGCHC
ncbi:hypothetical protein HanIR_Chr03g0143941 [Helianthus annuus]|nr:hypothetical protein HanIR_Chr03g0143941 [Helianthus annuus]